MKGITEDDDSKAYQFARYILTVRGGVSIDSPRDEKVYLSLKNDLNKQLSMVLYCVASGSMGSICYNTSFKHYMQGLNDNHHPPYRMN